MKLSSENRKMASQLLKRQLLSQSWSTLQGIKVFLFDCDGVLWKGDQVIEKATETVNYLIESGKHVYFVVRNWTFQLAK